MGKCYRSELVGAFGCPIDENPTGVMEDAAFAAKGLNFRYLTIKVNQGDLKMAMEGVRAMNMRGINLTIPHKVEVLQYLDELSEAAEIIGAVNEVLVGLLEKRAGVKAEFIMWDIPVEVPTDTCILSEES